MLRSREHYNLLLSQDRSALQAVLKSDTDNSKEEGVLRTRETKIYMEQTQSSICDLRCRFNESVYNKFSTKKRVMCDRLCLASRVLFASNP